MENNSAPKKIKWRLNLFDVIFIVCALIAAGLILNYSNRSDSGESIIPSSTETIIYTAEFQQMRGDTALLIQPGDALVDKVEKRAVGTVVSVEVRTSTIGQKDLATGERIVTEIPDRTDAILVVSAQANVTDSQISVSGYDIRVGKGITFNGPMYNGIGFIIGIERGDMS